MTISFIWTPAHIGIKENDIADVLDKDACKLDKVMEIYSKSELIIKNSIIKQWQCNWDREVTGRHYI